MIKVDWSKAPNWATHAGIIDASLTGGLNSCIVWYNAEQFCRMSDDRQRAFMWSDQQVARARYNPKESQVRFFEERPECWNGEGLPPVGTVCEFYADEDTWRECKIVGENEGYLIVWVTHAHIWTTKAAALLRPIRTPEQIAEDQRQAEINEMYEIICGPGDLHAAARRAHAAGYRKQVAE